MSIELKQVLIIGAGTMGRGIAQWFSQQNIITFLTDTNEETLKESKQSVYNSWEKLEKKGKFSSKNVDSFKNDLHFLPLKDVPSDQDLIIEAIIEDLKIKQMVFSDLDARFFEKTIFATNTSSISVESIASCLSEERKKKFLGLHFFNPATIMKLVEVIEGPSTNKELSLELFNWFSEKGKKPAICKDRPGFIVNRVARGFYGEALRIIEDFDQEKIKELDLVMKESGGFRMGPFELLDLIGIDVNLDVTYSVWEAFKKEPRFAPHQLQEKMVKEGNFGKKSGKGFYQYE